MPALCALGTMHLRALPLNHLPKQILKCYFSKESEILTIFLFVFVFFFESPYFKDNKMVFLLEDSS